MGGELQLIRAIRERASVRTGGVPVGIGDDCAVLRPPTGHDILVTTDFSMEGRHFRRDWHPPQSVGHRCLARGLSDLAAMGARPLAAFLSLALPEGFTRRVAGQRWMDSFLTGLLALADAMKTPLAGGDTATAPGDAVLADIVLVGSAPRGTEMRRSGAKAGDLLYVTGWLGGSAAELAAVMQQPVKFRSVEADGTHPHLFPVPRLAVGERLRRVASAALDVSDGLSTDLRHLCEESGVGAVVDASLLPLHPLLNGRDDALQLALHGGEDYELLFTAPPSAHLPKRVAGVPITRIGEIRRGDGVTLRMDDSEMLLEAKGWEHGL